MGWLPPMPARPRSGAPGHRCTRRSPSARSSDLSSSSVARERLRGFFQVRHEFVAVARARHGSDSSCSQPVSVAGSAVEPRASATISALALAASAAGAPSGAPDHRWQRQDQARAPLRIGHGPPRGHVRAQRDTTHHDRVACRGIFEGRQPFTERARRGAVRTAPTCANGSVNTERTNTSSEAVPGRRSRAPAGTPEIVVARAYPHCQTVHTTGPPEQCRSRG